MIRSLRQRHRRIFTVLFPVLLLAFAVGIAARRAVPQAESLPPELTPVTQVFTATDYERADLFDESPVRVRLWREQYSGRLAVGFTAAKEFLKPDLMVYWSAARPVANDPLPSDASLLGAFVAGPLALPEEASTKEGRLILFSLANHEIVDVSKPTRFAATVN